MTDIEKLVLNLLAAREILGLSARELGHAVKGGRFQLQTYLAGKVQRRSVWHTAEDHLKVLEHLQDHGFDPTVEPTSFFKVEDGQVVEVFAHPPQSIPGLIDLHHKLKGDL